MGFGEVAIKYAKPDEETSVGFGAVARKYALPESQAAPQTETKLPRGPSEPGFKLSMSGLKNAVESIEPKATAGLMGLYAKQREKALRIPGVRRLVPIVDTELEALQALQEDIGGGFGLADWLGKRGMTALAQVIRREAAEESVRSSNPSVAQTARRIVAQGGRIPPAMRPESLAEFAGLVTGHPIEEVRLPVIGKATSPVNLAFALLGGAEARRGAVRRGLEVVKAADKAEAAATATEAARRQMLADFTKAGRTDARAAALAEAEKGRAAAQRQMAMRPRVPELLTGLRGVRQAKVAQALREAEVKLKPEMTREARRLLGVERPAAKPLAEPVAAGQKAIPKEVATKAKLTPAQERHEARRVAMEESDWFRARQQTKTAPELPRPISTAGNETTAIGQPKVAETPVAVEPPRGEGSPAPPGTVPKQGPTLQPAPENARPVESVSTATPETAAPVTAGTAPLVPWSDYVQTEAKGDFTYANTKPIWDEWADGVRMALTKGEKVPDAVLKAYADFRDRYEEKVTPSGGVAPPSGAAGEMPPQGQPQTNREAVPIAKPVTPELAEAAGGVTETTVPSGVVMPEAPKVETGRPTTEAVARSVSGKKPWEMTLDEFEAVMTEKMKKIEQTIGKKVGTTDREAPEFIKAKAAELRALRKEWNTPDLSWRGSSADHKGIVRGAYVRGEIVPPEILSEYMGLSEGEVRGKHLEGRVAETVRKAPSFSRLLHAYEKFLEAKKLDPATVESRVAAAYNDPDLMLRSHADFMRPMGKVQRDLGFAVQETFIETGLPRLKTGDRSIDWNRLYEQESHQPRKTGGGYGISEHERLRAQMKSREMRKLARSQYYHGPSNMNEKGFARPAALNPLQWHRAPDEVIADLTGKTAEEVRDIVRRSKGTGGETIETAFGVLGPREISRLRRYVDFVERRAEAQGNPSPSRLLRLLKNQRGSLGTPPEPPMPVEERLAKLTGMTPARVARLRRSLLGEAHRLEREKWLTETQARAMKRSLTAPEIENLTQGEVSKAQLNKLINLLRARTPKSVSRKAIEEATGSRTLDKSADFEARRRIAASLLGQIPEGHRPRMLAKAFGKASMKNMGPEEIAGYVKKLKAIPGMKDLDPVSMLFASPNRIWPQLGERAYEAQRLTRNFLESIDIRAREAMSHIKGKMTNERKRAIFDAIEHTLTTEKPLPPEMLKAIGEGAEPFVKFARDLGDELFIALKTVNPSVKYRGGHILHYWKRTGFIDTLLEGKGLKAATEAGKARLFGAPKAEMKPWETGLEQMPADLPVSARVMTAGEKPRKGATGFTRDPFEALRLEASRVAFKVHWEPVLRDLRAAIAEAPPMHKVALEQWMGSLKGREGVTDRAVRSGVQWLYDTLRVQRKAPYKPLTRAGGGLVRLRYNAVLNMNPGPVVKNFFQRLNTFAEFGDEPVAYFRGLKNTFTKDRLNLAKEHGVIEDYEARELLESFRTGVLRRLEGMGMKGFNLVERWNRVEAFSVGYEWGKAKGMSEAEAVRVGLKGVADTQFLYGKIGMPGAFRNPVGRVGLQLMSWPVKQTEWIARHLGDAITATREGDRKGAFYHWGVLGRYAMINAGIIAACDKAGLDVSDFMGFGQFDFRSPMWLRTLTTLSKVGSSPMARYQFKRELGQSWVPAGGAFSKVVKIAAQRGGARENVLRLLSVRTKESSQLGKLYGRRRQLDERRQILLKPENANDPEAARKLDEARLEMRDVDAEIDRLEAERERNRR